MPPARHRPADDLKDAPSKPPYPSTHPRRKNAPAQPKDSVAHDQSAQNAQQQQQQQQQTSSSLINWTLPPPSLLSTYRTTYALPTPSTFQSPLHAAILSAPGGIGPHSPTMAKKKRRKQRPEQLAQVVRKHFNDLAVSETEVVVDFVYAVRNQDKNFRMRFAPPAGRPRALAQGHNGGLDGSKR